MIKEKKKSALFYYKVKRNLRLVDGGEGGGGHSRRSCVGVSYAAGVWGGSLVPLV